MRPDLARAELRDGARPDLVVLSPGPGRPVRFRDGRNTRSADRSGSCRYLASASGCRASSNISAARSPCSTCRCTASRRWSASLAAGCCAACRSEFTVGRYHSLYAVRSTLPPELSVTAETEDGVVMAVEHQRLPIAAVQFHPESVMTLHGRDRHADHRTAALAGVVRRKGWLAEALTAGEGGGSP